MKKVLLTFCLLLLSFCQQAFAMLSVSDQMLGAAQEYGRSRAAMAVSEMQKPWTVNETLGTNVYAEKENIIVYTPYLIVAMDAQNKAKAFEDIKLEDSRALASGYEQELVVGAVIDAPEKFLPENLQIALVQGDKDLAPYYREPVSAVSTEKIIEKQPTAQNQNILGLKNGAANSTAVLNKEKAGSVPTQDKIRVKMPVWNLQYYLYFDLSQINTSLPVTLEISDKLAGEREFRFHLANMD